VKKRYVYTLDLGKSWASGCWQSPATVSGADLLAGPVDVNGTEACARLCHATPDCAQFTVPASSNAKKKKRT